MPITLTGTFDRRCIKNDLEDGGYETITNGYVGIEPDVSAMYRIWYKPSAGDAFDTTETIKQLRIRMTGKKKTDESSGVYIAVHSYSQAIQPSGTIIDDGEIFSRLQSYSAGSGRAYVADGTAAQDVIYTTEDAAEISRILQYGVGLLATGDVYQITSCVLEVDITSAATPPVISLMHGFGRVVDGKYWHYPENPFTLVVEYSQEMESPIRYLKLEYTDQTGYTRNYTETGLNSITVPDYIWGDLPRYGTLRLQAGSEGGGYSEWLEVPFEVAMYDIRYTSHTSGSIVQSGDTLELTWETYPASGNPAIVATEMDPPTQFIRYIWYDDEELSAGTYTTESTYTIQSESLVGHTAIHIAVCEVYGDNLASRDTERASVMNLYIQQAAGVGGVTVSPLQYTDPDIYYPRITVSWESTGQAAYRIKVGDVYDSGPVWGTETSHKIPVMMDNGTYAVQVKVQDTSGIWGDWTEPVWVTVENSQTVYNTIKSHNNGHEAVITVTLEDPTRYGTVLFYRDGTLIGQVETGGAAVVTYTDRNANGTVQYFARCVSASSGVYGVTETVVLDAVPKTDGLILADGTWVPLRYTSSAPRVYRTNVSEETYAKFYTGRSYPVYLRSGRRMRELTMSYRDKGNDLADILEAAAGEMVVYKNRIGQVIHGELNGVSAGRGRMYCEVSFVIAQADHTDEILYKW